MTLSVKVEPINRDIKVMLAEDLSPEARSATLAQFAREALAEGESENESALGFAPPYDTFVDGSAGKSEDQVNPDGVIVYEFKLISDVISWIDDQLIIHSPVKSGRYERSHALFADGAAVDPSGSMPNAQEFVFLNLQPYARKIERGESPSAPNGVYEGIALLASSRFGNIARISFTYRAPASGGIVDWAQTASAKRMAKARHHISHPQEWLTNQPAIIIRPY